MTKINVGDLHEHLRQAGIPIHGVALDRPGQPGISIDFTDDATETDKDYAQMLVDAYDQDAVDQLKSGLDVSEAEIDSAKTVADLKVLLKKALRKG